VAITPTLGSTTLAKVGKKIQTKAYKGFANRSETWKMLSDLKGFEAVASQREVTGVIDITEQPSGSFISEFGSETNPITVEPQDLAFTWAFLNHRFTYSRTAAHLGRKHAEGMIIKQSVYQTQKLMEALTRRVGLSFYGVSTGVLCETTTNATQASGTYALNDGFGQSGIDDTTWIAQIFKVGDWVALVRSAALVANAIGEVTAVSTSGIAVTWLGSVDSDAGDQVVFANVYPQSATATLAGGTEYNKAPNGLFDIFTATSYLGLSGSTYPMWSVAGNDSTGGYITGTRIKKGMHEITNKGGGSLKSLIMAQGVGRALYQQTSSAVQFADPLGMEILGSVKAKSIKVIDNDPLCPPGHAFGFDPKSFSKWYVTEAPDAEAKDIEDSPNVTVDKLEGLSGHVLSLDFLYNFVCTRRADGYMWSGLTEA
jgi:hypothetical protein